MSEAGTDYDDELVREAPYVGNVSTLPGSTALPSAREFPSGFHGANPGPSHEEPAPTPAAAPRPAPAGPRKAGEPARRGKPTQKKKGS